MLDLEVRQVLNPYRAQYPRMRDEYKYDWEVIEHIDEFRTIVHDTLCSEEEAIDRMPEIQLEYVLNEALLKSVMEWMNDMTRQHPGTSRPSLVKLLKETVQDWKG